MAEGFSVFIGTFLGFGHVLSYLAERLSYPNKGQGPRNNKYYGKG